MQPDERDAAHLWDMVRYARMAVELTEGWSVHEFLTNRIQQLALERVLEIVGEAARRVSTDFRAAHPQIPWRAVIGNRNVLAHNYDTVEPEVLWTTATRDVPKLLETLLLLLPPEIDVD